MTEGGFSAATPAVAHWNLQDAQAGLERHELHLDRPAEIGVAQGEPFERLAADGAEGTKVGIAHACRLHRAGGELAVGVRPPSVV